jgi:hypothetical protein
VQSILSLSRLIDVSGVNQVHSMIMDHKDGICAMEFRCNIFRI